MRFVCLGLLTAGCQALAPPTELALRQAPAANGNVLSRRAVIGAAASALAVSPLASVAADGSWTYHEGGFTGEFWDGFKSTDSGFMYKFVEPGEGDKPVNMQQVFVHYTGYLLDGTRFDSSYDRSDPFKFRLGKGKVIPGWEAVVAGMRPGQKVIVKIPPQYAYGDKSVGPIPPNSPLVRVPTLCAWDCESALLMLAVATNLCISDSQLLCSSDFLHGISQAWEHQGRQATSIRHHRCREPEQISNWQVHIGREQISS